MKKVQLSIGLVLLALLTLTFTSCEKDGDSPDYVGTWVNEETDNNVTFRNTLTLSTSSFDMLGQMVQDPLTMDIFGMKGGLSVTGNQITITPTSLGMTNDIGTMEWVNKGDEGWAAALAEMDMDESETVTYKVEGNQLTITMEGEDPEVYTKK